MGDEAFAAPAGAPVVVGRSALAHAFLREREHELLGLLECVEALLTEFDIAIGLGRGRGFLAIAGSILLDLFDHFLTFCATSGIGPLQIAACFSGCRVGL